MGSEDRRGMELFGIGLSVSAFDGGTPSDLHGHAPTLHLYLDLKIT